jgi:stress response protein YsnF
MARHNLVAVYYSRGEAERALDELLRFGIPAENMRLNAAGFEPTTFDQRQVSHERRGGFWDWLFGNDVPEHDQSWYSARLGEGRTALSVLVDDDAQRDRIAEILERFNPIDFDEPARAATVEERGPGIAIHGPTMTAPVVGHTGPDVHEPMQPMPADRSEMRTEAPEITSEDERVIPVTKEELAVGKRAAERRYRIRTYTVETPVEESVTLHDERVVVERRPATSGIAADPDAARDREFEVIERHEEPVVEKRVTPVEEVVVRKESADRVETVRDTVRETKVDVEKGPEEHHLGAEAEHLPPEPGVHVETDRPVLKPRVDIEKERLGSESRIDVHKEPVGAEHSPDLEERKP